jgi:hypothetical protein
MECWALLIEYGVFGLACRALFMECWALLLGYMALWLEYRPFFIECKALLAENSGSLVTM